MLLTICGCGSGGEDYVLDEAFYTEDYLPEYDMQMEYDHNARDHTKGICQISESVYLFATNQFIYYYDEAAGQSGKLCGKPECTHASVSCNAYVGTGEETIQMYDGKLYFSEDYNVLYRMNPDGTDREQVMRLNVGDGNADLRIHRGYVYTDRMSTRAEGGTMVYENSIHQYVLGDEESEKVLFTWESNYDLVSPLWVLRANEMYVITAFQPSQEEPYRCSFIRYDLAHGTQEVLREEEGGEWRPIHIAFSEEALQVSILNAEDNSQRIVSFDFESQEWTDVFQCPGATPQKLLVLGQNGYINYVDYTQYMTGALPIYQYLDKDGNILVEEVFPTDGVDPSAYRAWIVSMGRDDRGNIFFMDLMRSTDDGYDERQYWIRVTPDGEAKILFEVPVEDLKNRI